MTSPVGAAGGGGATFGGEGGRSIKMNELAGETAAHVTVLSVISAFGTPENEGLEAPLTPATIASW